MPVSRPAITIFSRRIAVDLPHLAFATGIAAWSTWFCWDAWRSSPNVENLILIVPASIAAAALYLVVAAGCFHAAGAPEAETSPALAPGMAGRIAGTMALLAAFVVAGPLVGFDAAGFTYILAMLLFLGERRVLVLVIVPVLFCAAAIYGFNQVLAIPLPLLLVSGEPA